MSEILDVLSDPARSRIYLEALLNNEITVQHLSNILNISRSTLGYHLVKMVENNILEVRTDAIGRQTKYYRVSDKARQEKILEEIRGSSDAASNLEQYAKFLEVLTAHLQAIASLSRNMISSIRAAQKQSSNPINRKVPSHFIFTLLTEEEAQTWNKQLCDYLIKLENEIDRKRSQSSVEMAQSFIAFSGVIPNLRKFEDV
ncbi:MAG: winged helix-turn-helix domain-containing protein [Candidatus Thorarchaeota archaeon]|jgi:DNA-binding transcriptional ArsR family regulator